MRVWLLTLAACASGGPPPSAPCPPTTAANASTAVREARRDERSAGDPVAALRALSLEERCALAGALAENLMNLADWLHLFDKYTANDRATLVVFVDREENKLIANAERCPPTTVRSLMRGKTVRVEHAGTELPLKRHLLLMLDRERSNADAQRFAFTWPLNRNYLGNHPTLPGQVPARHGISTVGIPAPTIELEVQRRGDTLAVTRFEVKMWRRDSVAR